jgi:hypothetical protein
VCTLRPAQHGFARNLDWAVSSTAANPNPDEPEPTVELVLTENEYTQKMWPHKFKAVYTVTLQVMGAVGWLVGGLVGWSVGERGGSPVCLGEGGWENLGRREGEALLHPACA